MKQSKIYRNAIIAVIQAATGTTIHKDKHDELIASLSTLLIDLSCAESYERSHEEAREEATE